MSQQYSYGGGGYGAGGAGGGQGYGQPPHQGGGGGYGAPPPGQGGYGAPPPHQGGGYGAPGGGYGAGAGAGAAGGGYAPSSYGPPGGRPQAYTPNTGPPPGADPQLWAWFTAVDRDHSGNINPVELQQALVNGDWTPFELDTVKLLMTIFDVDRSGSITFNEERYCPQFAGLWKYIQDWQGVFRHFDADRSGSIDQTELSRALANFGYNLNPRLLHIVVAKFSTPRGGVTFDRFVRCCVVIKTLTDNFARKDVQRTGHVTLSYDEFMELCLSAP